MITEDQLKNTPFVCEISNEDYHSGPGVSNSAISMLLDCPIKYWDKYLNPDKPEQETTPALRFGTMVHCILLEPDLFNERYFVAPKTRKGTKAYDELLAMAGSKEIISTEEEEVLNSIRKSVSEHKIAKQLLNNGHAEQSVYWNDLQTGVLCKTRPDYMTTNYIVDVKTTRCASWSEFGKSIASYGYHRQAAIALDGMEAISGIRHTNFLNLCVEIERPYVVSVFVMDDGAIEQGRVEYRRGLEIYKQCQETNTWPAYVDEVEEISLPNWARLNK